MKCALNHSDLYKTRATFMCTGCIFIKYNNLNLCKKVNMCNPDFILKRSRFQSDVFTL